LAALPYLRCADETSLHRVKCSSSPVTRAGFPVLDETDLLSCWTGNLVLLYTLVFSA
jgi:hypothetical protein